MLASYPTTLNLISYLQDGDDQISAMRVPIYSMLQELQAFEERRFLGWLGVLGSLVGNLIGIVTWKYPWAKAPNSTVTKEATEGEDFGTKQPQKTEDSCDTDMAEIFWDLTCHHGRDSF